jgi:hypothetical protein
MWRLSLISLYGLICSKAFVGICMQGSYEKNTNGYINHLCVCVRANCCRSVFVTPRHVLCYFGGPFLSTET